MTREKLRKQALDRLSREHGPSPRQGRTRITVLKPSTYFVSMSSLGMQQIFRLLYDMHDVMVERAFLPDDPTAYERARVPLLTLESGTPVGDSDIIAISVAYEFEIGGLVRCLKLAGLPPRSKDRGDGFPLVILGGPLTFSNPLPISPFADVVVMGEGEPLIEPIVEAYQGATSRRAFLDAIDGLAGIYIPERHGERLIPLATADNSILPAYSVFRTPDTELKDMHLVEAERGCHRKCTFCVMRRSTNGGMRIISPERILATIPDDATKVGLVGAAVTDHPKLIDVVRPIVESGRQCSLASMRADRLTPELLDLLMQGGLRSITVAGDGASERLRKLLEKNIRAKHLRRAAEMAKESSLKLKVYLMVGVPTETMEDIDEFSALISELSSLTRISLGVAPFVAKRNTPLDRHPWAGIKEVDRRLARLRKGLRGKAEVRSISARWAWVEYELAQGGFEMAEAAMEAVRDGEGFAAWRDAIKRARAERPREDVP